MEEPSSNPLSTWRILWEALKLQTKNKTLMLPILLLTLITSSALFLANYFSISPLLLHLLSTIYAAPSSAPEDLKPLIAELAAPSSAPEDLKPLIAELAAVVSVFILLSFIISTFILITTVKATASTYLTENLTLKDLFAKVGTSWKGPLITQLLVGIFSFLCLLSLSVLVIFFALISNAVYGVILALFLYRGLAAVWALAVIVSVLEDGCYGMKALARARELIEERKTQGVTITLLMAGGVMVGVNSFSNVSVHRTGLLSPSVFGVLKVNVMGIWNMVVLGACTVFYYECKKSRGEEILSTKEGFLYTSVSSGEGDLA